MFQVSSKVVTIDGYEDVPPSDEKALKKAVAHQPVSVAIEASGRAFQLYESVSDSRLCLNMKDSSDFDTGSQFLLSFAVFPLQSHEWTLSPWLLRRKKMKWKLGR